MKLLLMVSAAATLGATACSTTTPSTTSSSGGEPLHTTGSSSTVSLAAVADSKRPSPPPLERKGGPTDSAGLIKPLNPYHPEHGMIHASSDGGCHVYVRDGKQRPPGSFPPATTVPCPDSMLAAEWGHCTGSGSIHTNEAGSRCICRPGDGDLPPPPFEVPCPKQR